MRRQLHKRKKNESGIRVISMFRSLVYVLFGFVAVIGAYKAFEYVSRTNFMPIVAYQIEGNVKYTDIGELKNVLHGIPKMGFFSTDVDMIKQKVEELRWVESAQISRTWPDRITVNINEYQPVAIWNGAYFISPNGDLIPMTGEEDYAQDMNQLYGPDGDHQLIMVTYAKIEKRLSLSGIKIRKLKLNSRRSIEFVLDDDVLVILGRDDFEKRVERLAIYYAPLKRKVGDRLYSVDLRYTNGISVTKKA